MSSLLRKVGGSIFLLSSSSAITKVISLISVVIITRVLSVADYGTLALVLSVTGPVSFISGFGLDTVITADLARSLGEKKLAYAKRLLISFARTKMFIVLAVIFGAWFFKSMVMAKFGPSVEQYFFLLSWWVVIQAMTTISELYLTVFERFKTIAHSHVIESVLKIIGVVIAWRTLELSVPSLIFIYTVAKAVSLLWNIVLLKNPLQPFIGVAAEKTFALFHILRGHGKWEIMTQAFMSQFVGNGVRPWIIRFFLGLTGLGVLSLANSLVSAVYDFIPIKKVIFPVLARILSEEKERASVIAQKVTKYAFLAYGSVALVAFFVVIPVVTIGFPKYYSAIWPFRLLLLQLVINGIAVAQPSFLYALRLQKKVAFYGLISLISTFTLLPLCLVVFGIVGSLLEKTIMMAFVTWLMERLLRRVGPITTWRWKNLFVFDDYDRYALNKIKTTARHVLHFSV